MIIKYIALVFGALFEVYCINVFISTFLSKKQLTKKLLITIFVLIALYHITVSCLLNGTILTIAALLTPFAISQLYESKQYIKLILTIGVSLINICSELAISGIIMIFENDDYISTNSDIYLYSIGLLLSKFIVFTMIMMISNISKRNVEIDNIKTRYLLIMSILPITTIIFGILMNQIILATNDNILKIIYVILNILLILSNIVTFEVIRNQNRLAKSEYELNLLKNNIIEQTKHYENLQSSQEEIRQLHHNMRSICVGAIAELKSGKQKMLLKNYRIILIL